MQPRHGFDVAVIKRGVEGVIVIDLSDGPTRVELIAGFPVTTLSTIGSGDVFADAFSARLAKGENPTNAASWAYATASVALQSSANRLGEDAEDAVWRLLAGAC